MVAGISNRRNRHDCLLDARLPLHELPKTEENSQVTARVDCADQFWAIDPRCSDHESKRFLIQSVDF